MTRAQMAYKIETERLLSFLASKRDVYVTEVLAVARDFKEEQLTEEVYGKEDVDAMFSMFVERIKGRIAKDLETTAAMAALMLEQALHAAENAGIDLNIDLAQVENEGALQHLRESTTAAGALRQGGGVMAGPGARLTSLGKEHARILQDKDRLELETTALRANVAQLQARYDSTSRDLTETRSQLATLQQQYNSARAVSAASASSASSAATSQQQSAASAELQAQIAQLTSTLERTRGELSSAVRERDSKLSESKQFEQLRGLMAKKNGQLAALRAKVAQYEPEWDGETEG